MSNVLVVIGVAIGAVALFVVAMSLTLIFKGHHIDSEISTNKNMQQLGIKCAVQETREDMGLDDCNDNSICSAEAAASPVQPFFSL